MNVDTLMAAMPGLDRAKATQYQPLNDAAMREFDIANTNRAQHWLAQSGHESLSLRYLEEIASGAAYEGRKDLGNTQPGDGVKYKGRGPIQVTGRFNYTKAAEAMKLDLVNQPQLASQPQHAFRISAWWWKANGCNGIADGGPGAVEALTRRINGGLNGLADRQSRYNKIRTLGGDAVLPGPGAGPTAEVDENMVASATAPGGSYHVFVATPGAVFVTWQDPKSRAWVGSGKGYMAGVQHFAPAPKGHAIVAIDAEVAHGVMHVFARTEDGASWVTWQGGGGKWNGGGGGWHAGFAHFAARP